MGLSNIFIPSHLVFFFHQVDRSSAAALNLRVFHVLQIPFIRDMRVWEMSNRGLLKLEINATSRLLRHRYYRALTAHPIPSRMAIPIRTRFQSLCQSLLICAKKFASCGWMLKFCLMIFYEFIARAVGEQFAHALPPMSPN